MKKFTENLYKKYNQTISVEKVIVKEKSKFQNILIFDSKYFGKILVLDNVLQITEFDHYFYSEMLSHLPILSHGDVKRVLIIGGGDGAIASEVLKHKTESLIQRFLSIVSSGYAPTEQHSFSLSHKSL